MRCNRRQWVWHGLFCLTVLLFLGCSKTDLVDIRGEVTLQGKPIDKGTICFIPEDGRGGAAVVDIEKGQYAAQLSAGPKRVEISSQKVVGQQQMMVGARATTTDVIEELVPEQCNKRSTLRTEVSSNGNESIDFSL